MIFLQAGYNQMGFEAHYTNHLAKTKDTKFVFVSESPVMKRIYEKIMSFSLSSSPVLILGAGGTGREATAREIFNNDSYSKNFIKFVCYGLNHSGIEKKLFGENNKQGLLHCGMDNTLFIKGLESWTTWLQNRFLFYLLNDKNGKTKPRLICSSSEELYRKVKEGHFSQDLFEILSQNFVILPSLSERAEDIPFLISLFNQQNAFKACITQRALQSLKSHSWMGNITELKNVCLQMSVLYTDKGFIDKEDLPIIGMEDSSIEKTVRYNPNLSLQNLIDYYIQISLNHFKSKKKCAKALGISVKTIYNRINAGKINADGVCFD